MTDNEIKKALEEHYKQVEKGYTDHLAYGGKSDEHEEKYIYMLQNTLDYINRLEAENKGLNKEVDRLSQVVLYNDSVTEMKVEEAKAEAYKEFADRLKEKKAR
jgi:hypothetical protein